MKTVKNRGGAIFNWYYRAQCQLFVFEALIFSTKQISLTLSEYEMRWDHASINCCIEIFPFTDKACTCNKISKTNGAEGDEAVVDSLRARPSLLILEHKHGHHKKENYPRQVGHQMDKEAGEHLKMYKTKCECSTLMSCMSFKISLPFF